MTRLIIKYRSLIIIISVFLTLAGMAMMPKMRTDPDIRNYIPHEMESRINTDLIENEFGVQDMIMIIFRDSLIITRDNLLRIREIDRQLSRMKSIENTVSLFSTRHIYSDNGAMIVDPAVNRIPENQDETAELKKELSSNPLAMGLVISEDFTMAAIAATVNKSKPEDSILSEVDSIIAANPGRAQVFAGGLPYIRKGIMEDVKRDGMILVPLALIIMLVFLWAAFREWKGMVLPFTVVAMSIAVAMGLAPLLGWKLSIISLIVPVLLIAVANDYGIHMIAKYQEIVRSGSSKTMSEITKEVVSKLRKPILFTGLTTIAGVLGLLTHSIIPARHVGIMAAAGIGFAIILTLFMLPAWLSMLKPGVAKVDIKRHKKSLLDRALAGTASYITRKPVKVLLVSSLLTLIFASGIFLIRVDSNQENFFPRKHPVKISSNLINSGFGGSQSISVMVKGDVKDPGMLNMLDRWTSEIEGMNGVGHVYTIAGAIKEMSKGLYEQDEPGYNSIPATHMAVSQLLEIYNMNGDPEDFDRLVDYDYSKAHIMIRLNDPETKTINRVIEKINTLAAKDNVSVITGGYAYIMSQFAGKIVKGQVTSLAFALAVVFILLSIIFRSLRGGLLSTLPILASVIFLLGFMGMAGLALDPATALLSSIMIGVGVDYTIHFLWRYKTELTSLSHPEAIVKTLTTTGRGIVFNALSVMVGFSVLIFSGFTSIRFFGYLVLISISVCLISALFVVPALMIVFKPPFIEPGYSEKDLFKRSIGFFLKRAVLIVAILVLPASEKIMPVSTRLVQPDNADKIMEQSRQVMKVNSFEAVSDLKITDSRGRIRERTNVTASKSYPDGTEKRIIRFLSPPDIEGTTILIYDHDSGEDEMWIYLPALRRSRRIISSEKGKSFMGSEFSNADMASPPVSDFNHTIVEGEPGDESIIIESIPVSSDKEEEYGYSKKISTLSGKNLTVKSIDFFDYDNQLFKRIEIKEYMEVEKGKFLVKHMTAVNYTNNRSSEIIMTEVSAGSAVKDELFLVGNLGR